MQTLGTVVKIKTKFKVQSSFSLANEVIVKRCSLNVKITRKTQKVYASIRPTRNDYSKWTTKWHMKTKSKFYIVRDRFDFKKKVEMSRTVIFQR